MRSAKCKSQAIPFERSACSITARPVRIPRAHSLYSTGGAEWSEWNGRSGRSDDTPTTHANSRR